jgi:SAM-dependent MidA family methyltransferase
LPQQAAIDAALRRLIEDDQMGSLFKAMEIRG